MGDGAKEEAGDYSLKRMLSGLSSAVTADNNISGENKNEIFLASTIRPSFPFFQTLFSFCHDHMHAATGEQINMSWSVFSPVSPMPKVIIPIWFFKYDPLFDGSKK